MSDIDAIRTALQRLRRIAWQRRYGGLMRDWKLAKEALAALERVEQPPLFVPEPEQAALWEAAS